ncbi:hypothetical protein ACN9MF_23495 [Methylobacterium fujisawaense]|uniref:hypothetical protein n=1 Tax=Methylobacterium fujisawaense TaxID=107400 RepID=UPI003CFA0A85
MASNVERLLLVIAGSEFSISEIRRLARWIEARGSEDFIYKIEMLRDAANMDRSYLNINEPRYNLAYNKDSYSETAQKIEGILISNTMLTRGRAAQLLQQLLEDDLGKGSIPEYRRIAFKRWLDQLLAVVPESHLLHLANKIRNDHITSVKSDWPLRRK